MPVKKMLKLVALGRAIRAYAKIVKDPNQLGEVFSLSDSLTNPEIMERIAKGFRKHPEGVKALAEKKRVHVDLNALERLPDGTLGRVYAKFMRDNGLTPDAIPSLAADNEYDFIRAHLYESHDMWHAVTGFGPDVAGELGLQAFYAAQVDGALPPAILAAGLLNTALFSMEDRERRMDAIVRGWEAGRKAKLLFGFDYAANWSRPVAEVRAELNIDPQGCGQPRPLRAVSSLAA